MANKTITDFTETSSLSAGDYAVVQNSTDGYQSFDLGTKLAEVDSDITQINSDLSDSLEGIYNVYGSKNLLSPSLGATSKNGVTLTLNDDGSVSVSGTATANIFVTLGTYTVSAGSYIITGCPSGGASSKYFLFTAALNNKYDTGSGLSLTLSEETTSTVSVCVISGTTIDATFYPMLRLASVSDDTYVPYAMTNKQITDKIDAIITAIEALGGSVD